MIKHKSLKALLTVPVVMLLLAGCGASNQSNQSNSSSNNKTEKPKQIGSTSNIALHKTYHIGQTANYHGKQVKLDNVYYWSGNDIDTPDSGNQYVMAQVTVTNKSNSDWDILSDDFTINDNGSSNNWDEYLESDDPHGGRDLGDGTLSKGATKTGFLYAQAKKNDKLKLQYQPDELNDYKKITFNIN